MVEKKKVSIVDFQPLDIILNTFKKRVTGVTRKILKVFVQPLISFYGEETSTLYCKHPQGGAIILPQKVNRLTMYQHVYEVKNYHPREIVC